MEKNFSAMERLKSLGDFSDPTGPAVEVQISSLEQELRSHAIESPDSKFRLTEGGPEQTIAEIFAELDEEDRIIAELRNTVAKARGTTG